MYMHLNLGSFSFATPYNTCNAKQQLLVSMASWCLRRWNEGTTSKSKLEEAMHRNNKRRRRLKLCTDELCKIALNCSRCKHNGFINANSTHRYLNCTHPQQNIMMLNRRTNSSVSTGAIGQPHTDQSDSRLF